VILFFCVVRRARCGTPRCWARAASPPPARPPARRRQPPPRTCRRRRWLTSRRRRAPPEGRGSRTPSRRRLVSPLFPYFLNHFLSCGKLLDLPAQVCIAACFCAASLFIADYITEIIQSQADCKKPHFRAVSLKNKIRAQVLGNSHFHSCGF